MKKHLPIILLNFSGVYDYESFVSSQDIIHVDCRGLNGVDCAIVTKMEGKSYAACLPPTLPKPFTSSIRATTII